MRNRVLPRIALVVVVVVVVVPLAAAVAGCPAPKVGAVDAGAAAAATDGPASPAGGKEDRTARADIKANYDAATPPDPRAAALCDAIQALPAQKRAACCKEPEGKSPLAPTCAGILTAALQGKDVTFDEQKAKACADARAASLDGCTWIGTVNPKLPEVCEQILSGSLDDGARCRSSLECKPGLRCNGSSPLDPGRCGAPSPVNGPCGSAIDALSVVVPQPSIEEQHPSCVAGTVCELGRCIAEKKIGEACRSNVECGKKNACVDDKCAAGRVAVGGKCKKSECADGSRCRDGTCLAFSAAGGACHDDFDCLAGSCLKDKGAAAGVCGMRCSMF